MALPSGVEAVVALPFPHEVARLTLGGQLRTSLALTLYEDDSDLAYAAETVEREKGAAPGTTGGTAADDRALHLAVVALAWNHYRYFFPYFDQIDTDWDALLPEAITLAAQDDPVSFTATFRWLNAQLRDAHSFSYLKDERAQRDFRPPFRWRTVGAS